MNLIIVRHAKAQDRETCASDDLQRELVESGIKDSKKVAKYLAKRYKNIDLIVSSLALRSQQTAKYILEKYKNTAYVIDPQINPDSNIEGYIKYTEKHENIIIIGHEPNISEALYKICKIKNVIIKKSCIIELKYKDNTWQLFGIKNIKL